MPELVTHYFVSLLISSRLFSLRRAALISLVGLVPDLDALFRVHRWFTHSLVLATLAFIAAYLVTSALRVGQPKLLAAAYALYVAHILLDLLTAPTPLLWPIAPTSYAVRVGIDGTVSVDGLRISPNLAISAAPADFAPKPRLEGPIVAEPGLIVTATAAITLALEHLTKKHANRKQRLRSGNQPLNHK